MLPCRLQYLLLIVLLFVLSLTEFSTSCLGASGSIISEADKSVSEAYETVFDAERVGANVSGLVVRLDEAERYLTNAIMASRTGDFEEANSSAAIAKSMGQEIRDEAYVLRNHVSLEALQRFWSTVVSSVVGIVLIVIGSLWGWHILKGINSRKILEMKPEVFSDES